MTILKKSVSLNPGESKEVAFQFTPSEAKVYCVSVDGQVGEFIAIELALTHFWVKGLSWPEHFTKYGEDYGRIIRWRAIALLDEADYDPFAGWTGQFPDIGSELVDVSQPLHFNMPEGWQGAKRDEPNSTIIRLFFETDQGWYGFLDDSPWLLNIPDGGTITFEVTSSGARNWRVE